MGLGPAVTWDSARCRLRTVQVEAPRGPEMEPEAVLDSGGRGCIMSRRGHHGTSSLSVFLSPS